MYFIESRWLVAKLNGSGTALKKTGAPTESVEIVTLILCKLNISLRFLGSIPATVTVIGLFDELF